MWLNVKMPKGARRSRSAVGSITAMAQKTDAVRVPMAAPLTVVLCNEITDFGDMRRRVARPRAGSNQLLSVGYDGAITIASCQEPFTFNFAIGFHGDAFCDVHIGDFTVYSTMSGADGGQIWGLTEMNGAMTGRLFANHAWEMRIVGMPWACKPSKMVSRA
jgi:hypothetical protein